MRGTWSGPGGVFIDTTPQSGYGRVARIGERQVDAGRRIETSGLMLSTTSFSCVPLL